MLGLTKRIHRVLVQAPRAGLLAPELARLTGDAESLLDVGCGDGEVAARVGAIAGARRVEGVDVVRQPRARIPVALYDGASLPYADAAFDVALLSDVLHHAADPLRLVIESLRVARRAVVVKDHFAFGPVSRAVLLALDLAANRPYGIAVRGAYLSPAEWKSLVDRAEARISELVWPLHVHALPLRIVTRSELQFAARLERRNANGSAPP